MEIIKVQSNHNDFILLCNLLDKSLNSLNKDESTEERSQYASFNGLTNLHTVLLIYKGNEPVGCAAIKEYDPVTAEVKRVFIDERFRGKNYAKKLIHELECQAINNGFRTLILETAKNNNSAISLYKGLGFHVISNYPPYENMKDSFCMKKELLEKEQEL